MILSNVCFINSLVKFCLDFYWTLKIIESGFIRGIRGGGGEMESLDLNIHIITLYLHIDFYTSYQLTCKYPPLRSPSHIIITLRRVHVNLDTFTLHLIHMHSLPTHIFTSQHFYIMFISSFFTNVHHSHVELLSRV